MECPLIDVINIIDNDLKRLISSSAIDAFCEASFNYNNFLYLIQS